MQELYSSAQQEVHGNVHAAHQWVNMTDVTVQLSSTQSVSNQKNHSIFEYLGFNPGACKTCNAHTFNLFVKTISIKIINLFYYQVKTCKSALGHSFAAGTIDGGGDLNFTQGTSISILLASSCI